MTHAKTALLWAGASVLASCGHAQLPPAAAGHPDVGGVREQMRHAQRLGQLEANVLGLEARLQTLQAQLRAQRDAHRLVPDQLAVERWSPRDPSERGPHGAEGQGPLLTGSGDRLRVRP